MWFTEITQQLSNGWITFKDLFIMFPTRNATLQNVRSTSGIIQRLTMDYLSDRYNRSNNHWWIPRGLKKTTTRQIMKHTELKMQIYNSINEHSHVFFVLGIHVMAISNNSIHACRDDTIKWNHLPRCCYFVLGIHTVSGGRFKNAYELLNLRALKIPMLYKNRIFQCMGKIFCVEFQRVPLKFHTKYLAHTLKDVDFIQRWNFKSS